MAALGFAGLDAKGDLPGHLVANDRPFFQRLESAFGGLLLGWLVAPLVEIDLNVRGTNLASIIGPRQFGRLA